MQVVCYSLAFSEWTSCGVRRSVFRTRVIMVGMRIVSSDPERVEIAMAQLVEASMNLRAWRCWTVDGRFMGPALSLRITSAGRCW